MKLALLLGLGLASLVYGDDETYVKSTTVQETDAVWCFGADGDCYPEQHDLAWSDDEAGAFTVEVNDCIAFGDDRLRVVAVNGDRTVTVVRGCRSADEVREYQRSIGPKLDCRTPALGREHQPCEGPLRRYWPWEAR